MLTAGFSEIDITPPVGTRINGHLLEVVSTRVLDPLSAKVALFENGSDALAFISLDTLSIRWTQVNEIRRRIEARYKFPGHAILIGATHNHASPAVANLCVSGRDERCIETLVERVAAAFGQALENRQRAKIGFGRLCDFSLTWNRRVVLRDGSAVSQSNFGRADALHAEGPIDPNFSILAAQGENGKLLGAIAHFTCHLAGHGSDKTAFSAGHPGVLAALMKERGCPVTLYFNGCAANINSGFPDSRFQFSKEKVGSALAGHAEKLLAEMIWKGAAKLRTAGRTISLPYRQVTEADLNGTAPRSQRYASMEVYNRVLPKLVTKMRERGSKSAEVQALFLDELAWVGIPAEYFVEYGFHIAEKTHPLHTTVIGYANGMVGYVPTHEAFRRGGYEPTFADSSCLAPEAGDMLADAAIEIVKSQQKQS